jgi:regulator of protease activity HflC (stomatin/prohibitin superfamily)
LIAPTVRSAVYNTVTGYLAEDLYHQTTRIKIQDEVFNRTRDILSSRGIIMEQTPMRNIELPKAVNDVMIAKRVSEENIVVAQNNILVAEQNAEQKRKEAEGLRDYQLIINEGITQQNTEWKYIEALASCAAAGNLVLLGKDDAPMLFNLGR